MGELPAAGPTERVQGSSSLLKRLIYLTAFRLLIVTALLAATVWVTLRPGDQLDGATTFLLYGLIGFVYAASLGYLWLLRQRRRLRRVAYAQIAGDVLLATFLVYLTGGADSLFTLLYPLAIINASILLHRRGAIVAAVAAAFAFAALVGMLEQKLLAPATPYLAQQSVKPMRLTLMVLSNGAAFILTAALASYLTEQLRQTGQELSERELDYEALSELHGSIVQSLSSAILTTDSRGIVVFANAAAERVTGYTAQQLTYSPLSWTLPELSAALDVELTESGGSRTNFEVQIRGQDGENRWLGVVVTSLERQGERSGTASRASHEPTSLIVLEERTALRAMADAVRRSDRLAAVGELAAGLAHELRNPLGSMSGAVELLARATQLTESDRRLLDIVSRETERLNELVTDFLAFARPTPALFGATDVAALADDTVNVFRYDAQAARLEVTRIGVESLRIRADTSQLRQVLWNLLTNASEAIRSEGTITVEVSRTADGFCRLAVTDSGEGISPDGLARLFEPFYTTKDTGTGLGLASVHRIVEGHHGRMEVSSEPGKGSTFSVFLPDQPADEIRAA